MLPWFPVLSEVLWFCFLAVALLAQIFIQVSIPLSSVPLPLVGKVMRGAGVTKLLLGRCRRLWLHLEMMFWEFCIDVGKNTTVRATRSALVFLM